jgi:hypothetical protein
MAGWVYQNPEKLTQREKGYQAQREQICATPVNQDTEACQSFLRSKVEAEGSSSVETPLLDTAEQSQERQRVVPSEYAILRKNRGRHLKEVFEEARHINAMTDSDYATFVLKQSCDAGFQSACAKVEGNKETSPETGSTDWAVASGWLNTQATRLGAVADAAQNVLDTIPAGERKAVQSFIQKAKGTASFLGQVATLTGLGTGIAAIYAASQKLSQLNPLDHPEAYDKALAELNSAVINGCRDASIAAVSLAFPGVGAALNIANAVLSEYNSSWFVELWSGARGQDTPKREEAPAAKMPDQSSRLSAIRDSFRGY